MSRYILDTDHLTLHRYGHPEVTARVQGTPPEELAITIISIEEQLTGWYAQIRKCRGVEQLARAYEGLFQVVEFATRIEVLPFSRPALAGTGTLPWAPETTTASPREARPLDCCHRVGVQGRSRNAEPEGLRKGPGPADRGLVAALRPTALTAISVVRPKDASFGVVPSLLRNCLLRQVQAFFPLTFRGDFPLPFRLLRATRNSLRPERRWSLRPRGRFCGFSAPKNGKKSGVTTRTTGRFRFLPREEYNRRSN